MAMPTDPSTQSISFSQMQTEFGGSNPISIGEYYRNTFSPLVPGSHPATTVQNRSWIEYYSLVSGAEYYVAATAGQTVAAPVIPGSSTWYINGTIVHVGAENITQVNIGSPPTLYLRRGAFQVTQTQPKVPNVNNPYDIDYYKIEVHELVNQSVPAEAPITPITNPVNWTTPTISMFDFYGTEKYP